MLIADDEPDMRTLIAHVLRAEEIDIVEAATAEETVARWRDFRPDAIVLDQRMPPTTGLEIAESILHEEPGQVILLFTALVDAAIRSEAERLGITACVSKDQIFDIPELLRTHLTPG
ncbi:MAG: two-component system, NarL family, response regulator DesR [Acidimicrobiaceae bacterium]